MIDLPMEFKAELYGSFWKSGEKEGRKCTDQNIVKKKCIS